MNNIDREIIDKIIKGRMSEVTKKDKNKSPSDRFVCPLCHGKFSRQGRSIHSRTIKHKKVVNEIYERFDNFLSETILNT